MTVTAARLIKSHDLNDQPTRPRVRLADLAERTDQPATNDRFERLNLVGVSPQRTASRVSVRQKPDELQMAIAALNTAAADLQSHRDRILEQGQTESIKLGIAIAEQLLRRTLSVQSDSILDLVKTTLSWAVAAETVRVHLHPADCDFMETRSDELHRECSAEIQFVRDESLSRGDCLVETAQGTIDGRIETMLNMVG